MCNHCYEHEYGAPSDAGAEVDQLASLIVAQDRAVGRQGVGHIVWEDWNLEDEPIRWCLERAREPSRIDRVHPSEIEALEFALTLSVDGRASALRRAEDQLG